MPSRCVWHGAASHLTETSLQRHPHSSLPAETPSQGPSLRHSPQTPPPRRSQRPPHRDLPSETTPQLPPHRDPLTAPSPQRFPSETPSQLSSGDPHPAPSLQRPLHSSLPSETSPRPASAGHRHLTQTGTERVSEVTKLLCLPRPVGRSCGCLNRLTRCCFLRCCGTPC